MLKIIKKHHFTTFFNTEDRQTQLGNNAGNIDITPNCAQSIGK